MLLIVLHLLWLLVVLLSSVTTLLLLEATAPIIRSSWRPAHTCNHAKPVMRQRRAPLMHCVNCPLQHFLHCSQALIQHGLKTLHEVHAYKCTIDALT